MTSDVFNTGHRHVENPYVIILGISDYTKSKKKLSNLPGVAKDVNMWFDLFKQKFAYEYVFKYLNKFNTTNNSKTYYLEKKSKFNKLLSIHLEHLCDEDNPSQNRLNIDGIIFVYSGHGNEGTVISTLGNEVSISSIHATFNNNEVKFLRGYPRIYIFDCCRGGDQEFSRGKEQSYSASEDTIYWYGSSQGMKSFERKDKQGGFFSYEVYKVLTKMLEVGKYCTLSGDLSDAVFEQVRNALGSNQTPEFSKSIGYKVYLLPSKKSKFEIKIPSNVKKNKKTKRTVQTYNKSNNNVNRFDNVTPQQFGYNYNNRPMQNFGNNNKLTYNTRYTRQTFNTNPNTNNLQRQTFNTHPNQPKGLNGITQDMRNGRLMMQQSGMFYDSDDDNQMHDPIRYGRGYR